MRWVLQATRRLSNSHLTGLPGFAFGVASGSRLLGAAWRWRGLVRRLLMGAKAGLVGWLALTVAGVAKAAGAEGVASVSADELSQLRQAVESSGEVIFLTDRSGLITYVNPEFSRLYGYSADEVVGKTTPRILKSGRMLARDYTDFWDRLLNCERVKAEIINRCKDGRLVTVESSANAILNGQGRISGFLAIQRDVTERKRQEKELRQRYRELSALNAIAASLSRSLELKLVLDNALDEVLKLEIIGDAAKGMVFLLNGEGDRLTLAAQRGAEEGHPCKMEAPALGECLCGLAAQEGRLVISDQAALDTRHTRRSPTIPDHEDICLPLKVRGRVLGVMNVRLPGTTDLNQGDVDLLLSVADQISVAVDNAHLFDATREQQQRLREMAAWSAEMEEAERRRLSQELHDQVGQNLSALGLNLSIIQSLLPPKAPEEAQARLADSQALVALTTERIRDVMVELRPPILDDYGLVTALEWYAKQVEARTGLKVRVMGDAAGSRLHPSAETSLFRIAQEAINNVVKHAGATRVRIVVETEDGLARLTVEDNGCGFDPRLTRQTKARRGWGSLIMAERAEALGGRCAIVSDPIEGGTRVIAEVPP